MCRRIKVCCLHTFLSPPPPPLLLSKYPVLWIWIGCVLQLVSLLLLYLYPYFFYLSFLNCLSPSSPCTQSISCIRPNKVQKLPKDFLICTCYIILSIEHLGYMIQSMCVICVCVYLLHYTFVLISIITSISSFLDEKKHISIGVLTT